MVACQAYTQKLSKIGPNKRPRIATVLLFRRGAFTQITADDQRPHCGENCFTIDSCFWRVSHPQVGVVRDRRHPTPSGPWSPSALRPQATRFTPAEFSRRPRRVASRRISPCTHGQALRPPEPQLCLALLSPFRPPWERQQP